MKVLVAEFSPNNNEKKKKSAFIHCSAFIIRFLVLIAERFEKEER